VRFPGFARLTQTVMVITFGVQTAWSFTMGDTGAGFSNGLFTIAIVIYLFTARLGEMQREIMNKQTEAIRAQQKLNESLQESNTRLIDTLCAEARGRTMEQLDRQRRSTWS
jgi:hypothetical protein